MKEEVYLTILYDYYGELLTTRQQECFKAYYFDNLSLSEISDNLNISRNAIHKQLKTVEEKLRFYEDKLKLKSKDEELLKVINQLSDTTIKKKLEKLL